jgi:hypothetical protein
MSKKTRKKVARVNSAPVIPGDKKVVDEKLAAGIKTKMQSVAGKTYMSPADLAKSHKYVKDDLKIIAMIAIPMILALIIASFFLSF